MNRVVFLMVGSLFVLAGSFAALIGDGHSMGPDASGRQPLVLYCAASNRAVMETIRERYEREYETPIEIQYGPSQTLISAIEVTRTGDLFLPADDSFLTIGQEKALIGEMLPIARMHAIVAIREGNPKSIRSLDDLLRDDVRLVLANPETAAVGRVVRDVLAADGHWSSIEKAAVAYRATVTEVASDVAVGAADAGIVYDAVLHTYPNLTFVEIPELVDASSGVAVGLTAFTQQRSAALHFARYVCSPDRGLRHYEQHGFRTASGDRRNNRRIDRRIDRWGDQAE